MMQAPQFDGLSLDPFSLQQDGLAASEVNIGRIEIVRPADPTMPKDSVKDILSRDVDGQLQFNRVGREVRRQSSTRCPTTIPRWSGRSTRYERCGDEARADRREHPISSRRSKCHNLPQHQPLASAVGKLATHLLAIASPPSMVLAGFPWPRRGRPIVRNRNVV